MRLVIYKFGMLVMLENVPFQKRPTIDLSKCVYSGVLRKLAYYYSPPYCSENLASLPISYVLYVLLRTLNVANELESYDTTPHGPH